MARQIIDTATPQPGGKMGDTAKVAPDFPDCEWPTPPGA